MHSKSWPESSAAANRISKISLESPSHIPIPLQHGDSGSWVIDRTNGRVFGHVIASTDTSAFLMPLIHTIDAISSQARLNKAGDKVFLPPAFDMFADLAHAHYNRSTKHGQDAGRWFASQALKPSKLLQSPTSAVAPIITKCLESHQELQEPIKDFLQKLLMQAGANLENTVAEIWHNGRSEGLINTIDVLSGMQTRAAQIVIRNLVTGLDLLSAEASGPLWSICPWESVEVVQAPTGTQSVPSLIGGSQFSEAPEMVESRPLRLQTPQFPGFPEP